MRKDMFKVIVERPRWSFGGKPRVKLRHDPLPDRAKVGTKRFADHQNRRTKELNENLAPLRRYLKKQRGRPWSKVYSEIRATIDARSTVKQHVLEHLEDLIVVRVSYGKDGTRLGHGFGGRPWPLHESHQELYVDPKDGIVKEIAALRRKMRLPVSRCERALLRRLK